MSTVDRATVWKARSQAANHDDVFADHVEPLAVPRTAGFRQQRIGPMFVEPFVEIVEEILLAPQHPGQSLPHHIGRIFAHPGRRYRPIELVGVAPARLENLSEPRAERFLGAGYDIA